MLLAAGAAAALACTPAAGRPGTAASAGPERLVGRVAVVGSAPVNVRLSLQTEDGRSLWVEGPAAAELRTLSGARVEVEGRVERGALRAARYRILSVDGQPVVVGTVERAPGGGLQLRLDDGSAVRLAAGADHLRPGQKVWVQGVTSVQVQTSGVITP